MQISLQELAKSSVQDRLRSPLELAERNRRQFELLRDEVGAEIVSAARDKRKKQDADSVG
jgi:hypothetical protein